VFGWRQLLCWALVCCAAGCNQNDNAGISFAFQRAEHLEFACFAPLLAPKQREYVPLPQQCCRVFDSSSAALPVPTAVLPECQRVGADLVGSPALHAVATQSTRGEVAAVDLVNRRVLDSDKQVPGYTFLDTGGLPTAIVVPSHMPRALRSDGSGMALEAGPAWTYVASAEQMQVRAIPTCRFRSGTLCGPDLEPLNGNSRDPLASTYDERTRVQLPSPPADMQLGPGPTGQADESLWVSLPELGVIARIDLAEVPVEPVSVTQPDGTQLVVDVAKPVDPFATVGDTMAARRPKEPVYFRVPSAPDAVALAPEEEDEASRYEATCGLGYAYRPSRRKLPVVPPTAPTDAVWPTQVRYDATSRLLLVADRVAPVLHAFWVGTDGVLTSLGGLPTGSPLRSFVITPTVPSLAHRLEPALDPAPAPAGSISKRYVYASDADGRLMVFDFVPAPDGGSTPQRPILQPLLAPTPGTNFDDRIDVPGPINALEVIDTRGSSDYVCGSDTRAALQASRDERREALAQAPAADKPAIQRTIDQLDARLSIYDNAAPNHVRGVFVVAAAVGGVISVIDVPDLDLWCRARKECCSNEACSNNDLTTPRTANNNDQVAVRRHSSRRRTVGGIQAVVSLSSQLRSQACQPIAEPFEKLGTSAVCAPADPWMAISQSWSVEYQAPLPGTLTPGAVIRAGDEQALELEVLLPVEFDACAAGTEVGDLVAVVSPPDELRRGASCPEPTNETALRLEIKQAFNDRLVVTPALRSVLGTEQTLEQRRTQRQQLLDCYPDLAGIELRAGSFLVTGSSGVYLHRVITGDDGSCVIDPDKDELLTSRLRSLPDASGNQHLTFKNPYVEFTLSDASSSVTSPEAREVQVQVINGSTPLQLTSIVTGDSVADALPATLRYVPGQNSLFILDSASQGLRRYTLRPFQHDGQTFR
jgi:hypothetical protein